MKRLPRAPAIGFVQWERQHRLALLGGRAARIYFWSGFGLFAAGLIASPWADDAVLRGLVPMGAVLFLAVFSLAATLFMAAAFWRLRLLTGLIMLATAVSFAALAVWVVRGLLAEL